MAIEADVSELVFQRKKLEQNHAVMRGILEFRMSGYWDWNIAAATQSYSRA